MKSTYLLQRQLSTGISIGIFLLGLLTVFSLPENVQACEPYEPDSWYLEVLEINSEDIPEKIKITFRQEFREVHVRNLLSTDENAWLLTYETQKLLDSEEAYFDGAFVDNRFNEESLFLQWDQTYDLAFSDSNWYSGGQGDLFSGTINDFAYPDYVNFNIAEDGLTGEPDPVEPQKLNLAFNVEDTLQIVPFTIHYEPNPNYDPNRERASIQACYDFNSTNEVRRIQGMTATATIQSGQTAAAASRSFAPVPSTPNPTPNSNEQIASSSTTPLWLMFIPFGIVAFILMFKIKPK